MTVYPSIVPLGPAESFLMRSSSCVQTDESSPEIVTLGAVHVVADGEGFDDEDGEALGLGSSDGVGELEELASAEALAGSTVSCPWCAGPQALRERVTIRVSPRVRRRLLRGPRHAWWR